MALSDGAYQFQLRDVAPPDLHPPIVKFNYAFDDYWSIYYQGSSVTTTSLHMRGAWVNPGADLKAGPTFTLSPKVGGSNELIPTTLTLTIYGDGGSPNAPGRLCEGG